VLLISGTNDFRSLWQLEMKQIPWVDFDAAWKVAECIAKGIRPVFPDDSAFKDICAMAWDTDPDKRSEFSTLYEELKTLRASLARRTNLANAWGRATPSAIIGRKDQLGTPPASPPSSNGVMLRNHHSSSLYPLRPQEMRLTTATILPSTQTSNSPPNIQPQQNEHSPPLKSSQESNDFNSVGALFLEVCLAKEAN
jgi:hypothetical protein